MTLQDIDRLAELARLSLTQAEKEQLLTDLQSIVGYIDVIQSVPVNESGSVAYPLSNVLREDAVTHTGGEYSEVLLNEAPKHQGNFLEVDQIIEG